MSAPTDAGSGGGDCAAAWSEPQHLLFQLANGCFLVSYLSPNSQRGLLALHAVLILGTWSRSGAA